MALKGNKGEWSEIYTLFKLLGDTQVYAGDGNLNKIPTIFYPIIKVLRTEKIGDFEYEIINNTIRISGKGKQIDVPTVDFAKQAARLLSEIKQSKDTTFSLPAVENFMTQVSCSTLKAKSSDKTDIKIVIHDHTTGINPTLGFSIKSRLGSPSTLLNPGAGTNFIYKITGFNPEQNQIDEINNISGGSKLVDRIKKIEEQGGKLTYHAMQSDVFENNLTLIDSQLPEIIAEAISLFFTKRVSKLKDIVAELETNNPLNYNTNNKHKFYDYKLKHFLTDVALGMTPTKVWNGKYDANGGYLIVKENGDVLCYHIYNKNDFEDYLINHTKLETASSGRYNFGKLEKKGSELYFKLNLQIRFL